MTGPSNATIEGGRSLGLFCSPFAMYTWGPYLQGVCTRGSRSPDWRRALQGFCMGWAGLGTLANKAEAAKQPSDGRSCIQEPCCCTEIVFVSRSEIFHSNTAYFGCPVCLGAGTRPQCLMGILMIWSTDSLHSFASVWPCLEKLYCCL